MQPILAQWEAWDTEGSGVGLLSDDQREEIEALSYVFDGLQLRMEAGGMVEIRLMDVSLEKHRAKVTIVLGLPVGYPNDPPRVSLHSATIPKQVLNKVSEEVLTHFVEGEPAAHALLMETEHSLLSMEVSELSSYFVACPTCNVKDLKAGRTKQPQPSGCHLDSCLTCGSCEVIPLRSAKPNREEKPCDFCFCEEYVMVSLPCGDTVCIECFQRFADVDVGAKRLKLDSKTGFWTITCPTHPKIHVSDVALLKMAAPRTFNQYIRFAFQLSLTNINAISCPLSACTNFPFIPGSRHNLQHCPYCYRWFCHICQTAANECSCAALKLHSEPHPPINPNRKIAPTTTSVPTIPIRVNYHTGHLDLDIAPTSNVMTLLTLCSSQVFHQTYYTYNADDPWGRELYDVPVHHMIAVWCGKILDPAETLSTLYPGAQLYVVLHYPPTRRMLEGIDDEVDLWQFRRGFVASAPPGKEKKGDFLGKKCPHCTKPVLHYYKHGCHHIGFAGEGCCDKHWCYACLGPHPCRTCPVFCDNLRKCKCPLCPDCKPGQPCPSCMGCPQCRPGEGAAPADAFDLFD